jgi:hypothetical protein
VQEDFGEAFGTHANLSKVIGYRSIAGHVTCQTRIGMRTRHAGCFPHKRNGRSFFLLTPFSGQNDRIKEHGKRAAQ